MLGHLLEGVGDLFFGGRYGGGYFGHLLPEPGVLLLKVMSLFFWTGIRHDTPGT